MASNKRNKVEKDRDYQLINGLHIRGLHISVITRTLNAMPNRRYQLSRQQVTNDIKAIKKLWREEMVQTTDDHITKELARINELEAVYWEQWQKSIETNATRTDNRGILYTTREGAIGADGRPVNTPHVINRFTSTIESPLGNPDFLKGVERCIMMRVKLLGLLDDKEKAGETNVYNKIYVMPQKEPLKTINGQSN